RERDLRVLREALRPHAVDDPEVDSLRAAAQLGRHLVGRDAEDLHGRGAMDVLPRGKRGGEARVAGEGRQEAQLYLAVVGREEATAFLRDEGAPDRPALLPAGGDVLEVG